MDSAARDQSSAIAHAAIQMPSARSRVAACSAIIGAHSVFFPAEWLEDFKSEILQFPHGAYNDQNAALSQYLNSTKTNAPPMTEAFPGLESAQLIYGDRPPDYF